MEKVEMTKAQEEQLKKQKDHLATLVFKKGLSIFLPVARVRKVVTAEKPGQGFDLEIVQFNPKNMLELIELKQKQKYNPQMLQEGDILATPGLNMDSQLIMVLCEELLVHQPKEQKDGSADSPK